MYLDPDFRKDAPKDSAYCVRCQKAIKDTSKAVLVTVNWDNWDVTLGGKELLGKDCFKIISNSTTGDE